jgi:hypothetical protein
MGILGKRSSKILDALSNICSAARLTSYTACVRALGTRKGSPSICFAIDKLINRDGVWDFYPVLGSVF